MAASTATEQAPLVRLLLEHPTVGPEDAFEFLGVRRDLGYRMLATYRRRIAKATSSSRPLDAGAVHPRRARDGSWAEIANYKVGNRVRCRSDLLLWMVFPEGLA